MRYRSSTASRRPLERGQFSWVTIAMLLALAGGGYMAWIWVPIYVTNYEVKQTVRDFMNQAVKNRFDEQLKSNLCRRLTGIEPFGPSGAPPGEPLINLQPSDITWERDTQSTPPMLHVALEYTRSVTYPGLDRTEEVTMSVEFTQDIEVPKWK